MPPMLDSATAGIQLSKGPPIWRDPAGWLHEKKLSRDFWVFFAAAFFFDFGFAVYFFLFNLYLLDLHFDERTMGLVGGALTLGSVAGTLPAGLLARIRKTRVDGVGTAVTSGGGAFDGGA